MDFHMLHQQGLSIHKIAALRGVSRNTVRRALRSLAPPTGKRRRERGCKLKEYEPLVHSWLKDTVVKDFIGLHRRRPAARAEARFYVKPGQQLQVDWAEMGPTRIDGIERKVYAFVGVLAWSRAISRLRIRYPNVRSRRPRLPLWSRRHGPCR